MAKAKEILINIASLADIITACNLRISQSMLTARALYASGRDISLSIACCEEIDARDLLKALDDKKAKAL